MREAGQTCYMYLHLLPIGLSLLSAWFWLLWTLRDLCLNRQTVVSRCCYLYSMSHLRRLTSSCKHRKTMAKPDVDGAADLRGAFYSLQAEIIQDPASYVEQDPDMAQTLLDQREAVSEIYLPKQPLFACLSTFSKQFHLQQNLRTRSLVLDQQRACGNMAGS